MKPKLKPRFEQTCKSCGSKFKSKESKMETCNPTCRMKLWRKRNRQHSNNYMNEMKKRDKEKTYARYAVYRDKKIRPELYTEECCICGTNRNIEFHHPLYSLPYLVYPLCKVHHIEVHRGEENSS